MFSKSMVIVTLAAVGLFAAALTLTLDVDIRVKDASAKEATPSAGKWSPTKPNPTFDVYYPGTEALARDEMRVIACGSGMPMPRLKQAAPCFLIELGNGDKFIFDMGTGSMERLRRVTQRLDAAVTTAVDPTQIVCLKRRHRLTACREPSSVE